MRAPIVTMVFVLTSILRASVPAALAEDNPYAELERAKPKAAPAAALTFAVNVNGRIKSYSDNQDDEVSVLLPLTSPWRCVRRRVLPASRGGMTMGTFVCSIDHDASAQVLLSTSCGVPGESHNSATLVSGNSFITLKVDCVSVEPMGF